MNEKGNLQPVSLKRLIKFYYGNDLAAKSSQRDELAHSAAEDPQWTLRLFQDMFLNSDKFIDVWTAEYRDI